jgi:uncharacterized protein YukE
MSGRSAHIDPVEAREFARELCATVSFYATVIDRLDANVSHLRKSWRDHQSEEFADEVKTLQGGLADYIEAARATEKWLDQLAGRAEDFQKHQLR